MSADEQKARQVMMKDEQEFKRQSKLNQLVLKICIITSIKTSLFSGRAGKQA